MMEEKSKYPPGSVMWSGPQVIQPEPMPDFGELQKHIIFLHAKIDRLEEALTRLRAHVFALQEKEWAREEREKERGRG